MKKNVIIGALALLTILLLMFGLDQRIEARENLRLIERLEGDLKSALEAASRQQQEAAVHMKMAAANAEEARNQLVLSQELLKKCKGK